MVRNGIVNNTKTSINIDQIHSSFQFKRALIRIGGGWVILGKMVANLRRTLNQGVMLKGGTNLRGALSNDLVP